MRRLYTDVTLETPFLVTYNNVQVQACANDEITTIFGDVTYIQLTDINGHYVEDGEGNQLLLNDGIIYKVVSGVPESTNVQVTDVVIPERYTLTINPTPNDATVTLTATGETQVGNSITADDGTTISYTVSASGYTTASGTYTLDGADHTENVVLELEPVPIEPKIDASQAVNTDLMLTLTPAFQDVTTEGTLTARTPAQETFDWGRIISDIPQGTTSLIVKPIPSEIMRIVDMADPDELIYPPALYIYYRDASNNDILIGVENGEMDAPDADRLCIFSSPMFNYVGFAWIDPANPSKLDVSAISGTWYVS